PEMIFTRIDVSRRQAIRLMIPGNGRIGRMADARNCLAGADAVRWQPDGCARAALGDRTLVECVGLRRIRGSCRVRLRVLSSLEPFGRLRGHRPTNCEADWLEFRFWPICKLFLRRGLAADVDQTNSALGCSGVLLVHDLQWSRCLRPEPTPMVRTAPL